MIRQFLACSLTCGLAVTANGVSSFAQEEQQDETLYLDVSCMKSQTADYESIENDIWLPIHQELVNQGKKVGWTFYRVLYGDRSECDYYTVNSYLGVAQLDASPPYSDLLAKVHPDQDWEDVWAKTVEARGMPRSELWAQVDTVQPTQYQYVIVNQMYTEDADRYLSLEREIWKPIAQALADGGHRAGWGLFELQQPGGTSIRYNYGTVDFSNSLGPIPFVETIRQVHPDREIAEIEQLTNQARNLVKREVWLRIGGTE